MGALRCAAVPRRRRAPCRLRAVRRDMVGAGRRLRRAAAHRDDHGGRLLPPRVVRAQRARRAARTRRNAVAVTTFEPAPVKVPDAVLHDLHERIDRTRWPNAIDGVGWQQGTPVDWLRPVVEHWRHRFDWRAVEAELNEWEPTATVVDGQRIHFLHARSSHDGALPMVLSHGWPGSVCEFLDVLDLLTSPDDPADAFHVVVPSLPGYGFSGPTSRSG